MSILSIIGITLIAFLTYITTMQISEWTNGNKRKRLSTLLQEDEPKQNSFMKWIEKRGIRQFVSPSHIMFEAKKHGEIISKQSYMSTFILGTVLGVVIFVVYFQPIIYLIPFALIGGFISTNIRLHNIKKKYNEELDSKLSIYMSSLSTAMGTFNNHKEALQSILSTLEYPVKGDVEEAIIKLQDGKSIRESFETMNNSYPQKYVRMFHDQLDVIVKGGTTDVKSLRSIAYKMKRKETYRRKLKTAHRQNFKIWRTFVSLSLSAPFLFIFISMDNYLLVMNHIASTIVFFLTFLLIFVTFTKLEKLEVYDPTADKKVEI